MSPMLQTTELEKRFGGLIATRALSLRVERGARHALIGRGAAITGSVPGMIGLVFGGILQTALLTLMAAIASLLFIALGTHVRRHARSSEPS